MTTLLISDCDESLADFKRALGESFELIGDSHGAAPELARALQPDLIVIEEEQEVAGHAQLSALRAHPETAAIPVVMISRTVDLESRMLSYELGAAEHGFKPLPQSFFAYLRRLTARRLAERRAA